jgi:hypothetical protein
MAAPTDIQLCMLDQKNQSRTEITSWLVFDPSGNRLKVYFTQDYETQAKIERGYHDAEKYFADHPEQLSKAEKAVTDYIAKNPKYHQAMSAALTKLKNHWATDKATPPS